MQTRTLTLIGWLLTGVFMLAGMYLIYFFPSYNDPLRTFKILIPAWAMPVTIAGWIFLPLLRQEPMRLKLRERWVWNLVRTSALLIFAYLSLGENSLQSLSSYDIALGFTALMLIFHTLFLFKPLREEQEKTESLIEEIGKE